MAAKTKRIQNKCVRDIIYKRALNANKKKTFINRINYEKSLPLKKRLFPIEFRNLRPRFKPTPYEKPVTRSQGRRTTGSNYANKENQSTSPQTLKIEQESKVNQKPTPIPTLMTPKRQGQSAGVKSTPVIDEVTKLTDIDMVMDMDTDKSIYLMNYFSFEASEKFQLKYILPSLMDRLNRDL